MATPTKEQVGAALDNVRVLADAIRTAGSIPSGHLYAVAMNTMSLATYQQIIGVLKGAKLVEEKNFLLTWVGPTFGEDGRRS